MDLDDLSGRVHWVAQPKIDGIYVRISLDPRGRVCRLITRGGRELTTPAARSLHGIEIGAPDSVLVGELEDHTEAGIMAARRRGFALCHVFDVIYQGRTNIARFGYRDRRDRLYRMIAAVADRRRGERDWTDDATGRAHDARGRYTARVPRDWSRFPVVPQVPARRARALWADTIDAGGEGIVAVDTRAPVGYGKRKIKRRDDTEMIVTGGDAKRVVVTWPGRGMVVVCRRPAFPVAVGDVVTVAHTGWFDSGLPRHPWIVRVRTDLQ